MKTIIVHLGAHKTGTTFLQRSLGQSRDYLRKMDIGYLTQGSYWPHIHRHFYRIEDQVTADGAASPDTTSEAITAIRDTLQPLIDGSPSTRIILSHEDLSGTLRLHQQRQLYPAFATNLAVLLSALDRHEVKLAFTVMDHATFLEAAALQMLQQGVIDDPATLLDHAPLVALSWRPLLSEMISSVGSSNVCLLASELRQIAELEATRRLVTFANPEATLLGLTPATASPTSINPSFSDVGVRIAKAAIPHLSREEWQALRTYIHANLSTHSGKKRAAALSPNLSALIRQFYRDEMAELLHSAFSGAIPTSIATA